MDVRDDVVVNARITIPVGELRERFSRSSGPGGQGVNTTDSRVELSFDVARSASVPESLRQRMLDRLGSRLVDGVVTVVASEHRAQLANREAARERLAALLAEAAAPPPRKRKPTKPSKGAKERRLAAKKQRGRIKRDRRGGFDGD
ncbi:MAG: aminoacyl-tRNA hydrolase [Actinophytocola sp.]|nr:aminoacyl-tRNA hydrolase [Actinophytocola sp.]